MFKRSSFWGSLQGGPHRCKRPCNTVIVGKAHGESGARAYNGDMRRGAPSGSRGGRAPGQRGVTTGVALLGRQSPWSGGYNGRSPAEAESILVLQKWH